MIILKQVHHWRTDECRRMVSRDPRIKVYQIRGNKYLLPRPYKADKFHCVAVSQTMYEKSVTKITPFSNLASKVGQSDQSQHLCTVRPRLPNCQISPPSDNLSTRYLLPNFVDFVESVTDRRAWPTKTVNDVCHWRNYKFGTPAKHSHRLVGTKFYECRKFMRMSC